MGADRDTCIMMVAVNVRSNSPGRIVQGACRRAGHRGPLS